MQITEQALEGFRSTHLGAKNLLNLVESLVRGLVRVAIGVGKSVAADSILLAPETYQRFQLVLYAAPTWDILHERTAVAHPDQAPVPVLVLRPRPAERCGPLDERWNTLEQHRCGTLAKAELCGACPQREADVEPCRWPERFSNLQKVRLVIGTEQQLVNNRSLVAFLRARTGAGRTLVILDEGKLLDTRFEVEITQQDLARFKEILLDLGRSLQIPGSVVQGTARAIDGLLRRDLRDSPRFLPASLNRYAYRLQRAGVERHGDGFTYLGYDLADLYWSRPEERWIDAQGHLHFIARPYLHCHLLVLSAHLSGAYVGSRLGEGPVPSPYEGYRFRHTQSRLLNLRSRIGADRYFHKNHAQILDTFAVLLARNQSQGRTSVLVCRKKRKPFVAAYLNERLAYWGWQVEFLVDDRPALPTLPRPGVVPVIHYGVLGVNDYSEYESIYCLDGYYVSSHVLNQAVQEFEPEALRVRLEIVTGRERLRRVRVDTRGPGAVDLPVLGAMYLRRLEVDPVIQAVGRVRYATRPREVVTFQMAEMTQEMEGCTEVGSLLELRRVLGTPPAKDLDRAAECARIQHLLSLGRTAEQVATELGVSRSTVHRRRAEGECVKNPYIYLYRSFDTSPATVAAEEVVS